MQEGDLEGFYPIQQINRDEAKAMFPAEGSIRERFDTICREQAACGADFTITDDTSLRRDLQLDSLDLIDLSMQVEEAFDVEIGDEIDEPETETFGGMLDLIQRKMSAKVAA